MSFRGLEKSELCQFVFYVNNTNFKSIVIYSPGVEVWVLIFINQILHALSVAGFADVTQTIS